jgi:hypothetical protein
LSFADRPAAGLYVAAWALCGLGFGALFVYISGLIDPQQQVFLIVVGIAALVPGMIAAAGYQLVARASRPAEKYRGPGPLILFALQVAAVNAIGVILFLLGVRVTGNAAGFMIGAVPLVAGYVLIVWLFVVRSGALSWREMLRAEPLDASRAAFDIIIGAATMFGVAIVAGLFGALIATLLETKAPEVVPPLTNSTDVVLALIAAGLLVPIGEEVFL